jgi:sulfate/thiosulfate transport system permease protein
VTLFVQERYQNFDQQAAYASALVLVLAAVIALLISRALRPKEITR